MLLSLAVRTFDIRSYANGKDESRWFPFSSISFDTDQVKSLSFASYNKKDSKFTISYDVDTEKWLLQVSTDIDSITGDAERFEIPIYFEYVDNDGISHNSQETFAVYGIDSENANPYISYIENIASEVGEPVQIVLHGKNFNTDLGIFMYAYDGTKQTCYKVDDEDVVWNVDGDDDTATFTLYPCTLNVDDNGYEACGTYPIYLGYGDCGTESTFPNDSSTLNLSIIRYKYNSENDDATTNSTSSLTSENKCYQTSNMTLVEDNSSDIGSSASTGTYGDTMYVRVDSNSCSDIKYYRVKLKYDKNLRTKSGEMKLDGVYLLEKDIVWLSNQFNTEENGLWIVSKSSWIGVDTDDDQTDTCVFAQKPLAVDKNVFIDLGAKVTYDVDYACSDDVPVKYGPQTACSYSLKPGDVVALSNQTDGYNGLWVVSCSWWTYLGTFDGISGTTVDLSSSIIVQNDIDFCNCGQIAHIDYYYLNPTCYLTHLQRNVKIMCSGASIAPNSENQFIITEYQISTGENDELVGNNGRTAGDPELEDCVQEAEADEDVVEDSLNVTETRPDDYDYTVINAPDCTQWCDMPRYYNVTMTSDYTNSNDTNGFTILFWQYGTGGWHLYAYIGSGTQLSGMKYYVYHLHVKGVATTTHVDINNDTWFTPNDGVLADDFGLVDDTWEFAIKDSDGKIIDTTHILYNDDYLYQPWRIKCTTTFMAHRTYEEEETALNMRKTCADMSNAVKTELAKDYLIGCQHVYGFSYYKRVMSISEFCSYYNKFNPSCIWVDVVEVIGSDSETAFNEPVRITSEDDERYIRK